MEFRLLGVVAAGSDGAVLDLGPGRQQCVLAALLVDVNQVVSIDQLQARVWGDDFPYRARGTLYSYLSRLRRVLGDGSIARRSGGYVLCADPATIDLHRFQHLIARIPGADDEALPLLEQALGLWRGEAFAGLDTPWLNALRDAVSAQREAAELDYIDLRLRRGQHGVLLSELTAKAAARPLDERLAGQLMLAQYRNGRQADALAQYEQIRHRLGEELGIEPGPELRDLQLRVLRHEVPAVREPATRLAPEPDPAPTVPRQLPAASAVFTGRAGELAELSRDGDPSTVAISAIHGMAGVGKTALAVRAAHQLMSRYPDGQIFLDLHGFTRDVSPVDPAEALDRILRALGVPDERVPPHLEDRSALLRTTLAERRVLLVLDNAVDEAQVEPLLPGSAGSMVLITSRLPLVGLDDARHLSLEVLPFGDSLALFAGFTGEDPASEVVAEIVELCGRLPLAIRIAAARLKARPSWTVSHLADHLRDHRHRLAVLDMGPRSITAAVNLSYRQLTSAEQRLFRLLSLHPGPDIDTYAAAALANTTVRNTRQLLDHLADAHLLQEIAPGRYKFHDLLRAHAGQTSTEEDSTNDRRAALIRLFDHYTHTAAVATDLVEPAEAPYLPRIRRPTTPAPAFVGRPRGRAAAAAWLDAELTNLLAVAAYAADHGRPTSTLHMASALRWYLHFHGRHGHVVVLLTGSLEIARSAGNVSAELDALCGLGHAHHAQGRARSATGYFEQALHLARRVGHRRGELDGLRGIGLVHRSHGRLKAAAECLEQALYIAREMGSGTCELAVLCNLGYLCELRDQLGHASVCFERVLHLARETGDQRGELIALHGLGSLRGKQGRHESAIDSLERALRIAQEIGDRNYQAKVLHGLGYEHRATGQSADAIAHHRAALGLARDIGQLPDQARALHGLAVAYSELDQPAQAREHWQHALDILSYLGVEHAEEISADGIRLHLDKLPRDSIDERRPDSTELCTG